MGEEVSEEENMLLNNATFLISYYDSSFLSAFEFKLSTKYTRIHNVQNWVSALSLSLYAMDSSLAIFIDSHYGTCLYFVFLLFFCLFVLLLCSFHFAFFCFLISSQPPPPPTPLSSCRCLHHKLKVEVAQSRIPRECFESECFVYNTMNGRRMTQTNALKAEKRM